MGCAAGSHSNCADPRLIGQIDTDELSEFALTAITCDEWQARALGYGEDEAVDLAGGEAASPSRPIDCSSRFEIGYGIEGHQFSSGHEASQALQFRFRACTEKQFHKYGLGVGDGRRGSQCLLQPRVGRPESVDPDGGVSEGCHASRVEAS